MVNYQIPKEGFLLQKTERGSLQLLRSIMIGGGLAALGALLLSLLFALLLSMERLPESSVELLAGVTAGASVLFGALMAVRLAGRKRLAVAMGTAAVYLLLSLLLRLICFDGGWNFVPGAVALLAALAAGLLSSRKKRRKR